MAIIIKIDQTSAECCYYTFKCFKPDDHKVNRCADCEEANVYCGYGSCNIFGCNCDGGCRKGNPTLWCWNKVFCENVNKSLTIDTSSMMNFNAENYNENILNLFENHDQNNDKMLDRIEFEQLIGNNNIEQQQQQSINIDNEFTKLDKDGNNFITLNEIDPDFW